MNTENVSTFLNIPPGQRARKPLARKSTEELSSSKSTEFWTSNNQFRDRQALPISAPGLQAGAIAGMEVSAESGGQSASEDGSNLRRFFLKKSEARSVRIRANILRRTSCPGIPSTIQAHFPFQVFFFDLVPNAGCGWVLNIYKYRKRPVHRHRHHRRHHHRQHPIANIHYTVTYTIQR